MSEWMVTALSDRDITKVDDLVRHFGTTARQLQRLFQRTVGVGPKWVIQRYRLHDAVERIGEGVADWAGIALELGYFDQAHFIRDFRAVFGTPPAAFAAGLQSGQEGRAKVAGPVPPFTSAQPARPRRCPLAR